MWLDAQVRHIQAKLLWMPATLPIVTIPTRMCFYRYSAKSDQKVSRMSIKSYISSSHNKTSTIGIILQICLSFIYIPAP